MGMSASQTRVLMLTARQNDLEFQAQQLLQAKLAASRQAEDAAAAYEEKISNTHFITKDYENGELTQKNVTYNQIAQNGYYLVDSKGRIVVSDTNTSYDEIYKQARSNPEKYGLTSTNSSKFYEDSQLGIDKGGAASYIKEMIDKGEYSLCRVRRPEEIANSQDKVEHKYITIDASLQFKEVNYTADDAVAEAKYNSITKKLETLEKKLDMQMEQIETERSAVKTEKESVEKVVKENVEKTFNTFG